MLTINNFKSPAVQNQLWSIVASGSLAIFASIIVFVITRVSGLEAAGVVVFAIALTELPRTLAIFNARPYQNFDVMPEFSFINYFNLRLISSITSSILFIVFLLIREFEVYDFVIILSVYSIYIVDAVADVFIGEMQRNGVMRIAGKMQAMSYLIAIVTISITLVLTNNLILAFLLAFFLFALSYIVWIWINRAHFGPIRVSFDKIRAKTLTFRLLPLLIGSFFWTLLFNSPKFFLETFATFEDVALIGILMMPVSLLILACTSFFHGPIATKTAEILASGDITGLKKRVNLQLLLAFGICILFVICVYFLGIPILSFVYDLDLTGYKTILLIIALGGLARAPLYVIGPIAVMMKKLKANLAIQISAFLLITPIMYFLVLNHGLIGASFFGVILYFPVVIAYYILYRKGLKEFDKSSVA